MLSVWAAAEVADCNFLPSWISDTQSRMCGFDGPSCSGYYRRVRKEDMLAELTASRAALDQAIAGLSVDQMLAVGAEGIWSVKDVLAHLVAWESEVVTALNHVQNKRTPAILKIDDIDQWNEQQYHINVRRPLEAVLADYEGVHRMLYRMVEDFDERLLDDRRRFPWMEGEPLWFLIQENVTLHEREHAEDILAWRALRA